MLHKTRGIVLKAIRHTESSLICRIYTEKFGLQSYLIYGARKRKAKIPAAILQPLHLLDMVVYHKNSGALQKVSEARQLPLFEGIPYDVEKQTIILFLAEILNKVIKLSEAEGPLFEFLYTMIVWFDGAKPPQRNFHLFFLLKLTQYLGIYPGLIFKEYDSRYRDTPYLAREPGGRSLLKETSVNEQWERLLNANVSDLNALQFTTQSRRQLLNSIISYYEEHLGNIEPLKSQPVLESVWA